MRRFSLFSLISLCLAAFVFNSTMCVSAEPNAAVDFAEEVQPILRRNCYRCHSDKNQEASLRLDLHDAVFATADSGEPIVVKHAANDSLLIKRIEGDAFGDVMPPDSDPLSAKQVNLLRRWIDQGAEWSEPKSEATHWAYAPITRPELADDQSTLLRAIDYLVQQRLDRKGLIPSPPAARSKWLRRVSLALTGIPPTVEQVDAFLKDDSEDSYEKAVDRLLQSPQFGERWAVPWLDAARYADSNGFQADQIRDNWAYRDWVIRSLNADMPIDQFVIEQLAGDLLPGATVDQRIATGFHRMTTCNVEAGVHPEANRVNQVVDRVNTTAMALLATTMECAQCHDHKYDPFSQKDYYQLFAYFNNTPMEVKQTADVTYDFDGPMMELPLDDEKRREKDELEREIAELEQERATIAEQSDEDFAQWLALVRAAPDDAAQWHCVTPHDFEASGGEDFQVLDDGSVLLSGLVPDSADYKFSFSIDQPITAIRLDALTDPSIPGEGPGRGDEQRSNFVLHELTCEVVSGDKRAEVLLVDAVADFSQTGWDVTGAIDGDRKTGWAIAPQFGKPHWAWFRLKEPLRLDPKTERLEVTLGQYFGRGRVLGRPRISFFHHDSSLLLVSDSTRKLAKQAELTEAQLKTLRSIFDKDNVRLKTLDHQIGSLRDQRDQLRPDTTLVMVEMESPRETFVLTRGDYEQPAEKVLPQPPSLFVSDLDDAASEFRTADRLELAHWITSPQNPLFARVMVNRWWAELFGTGIVSTVEDFGTQSEPPSHPLLLDWLASELIDSGWSMKHVLKQIVLSKTFGQDSSIRPEQLQIDANNRMLARGPRFRMSAEMIRDNALAISGMLSHKMYGPPVMPYQPDNLWRSVGRNQPKWVTAKDEDRFRRGLYVVYKRAAPYPSFITFDAPDRGACVVSRGRTNTPLQALTLLNDPAYAELALAFADHVLQYQDATDDDSRIRYALRRVIAREPNERELKLLKTLLNDQRSEIRQNPSISQQRTESPVDAMRIATKDRAELAAWFALTSTLLNLDETISF